MEPLFAELPEDASSLSDEDLASYIAAGQEAADAVAANPSEFVSDERDAAALLEEMTGGVAAIERARAELASREAPEEEVVEVEETIVTAEIDADALAELAARAHADEEEEEVAEEDEVVAEAVEEAEAIVAAAAPHRTSGLPVRLPRPSRSKAAEPIQEEQRVALTAAAEGLGWRLGAELPDENTLAEMMIRRRGQFGRNIPEGTHGDQIPIARAEWSELYPSDRIVHADEVADTLAVNEVIKQHEIRSNFEQRRNKEPGALVASGGLCAPVTPYYQLQMLSVADRPVRAALPAFNADRGGIKYARPATLASITTAVGVRTAAQDAAGGTTGAKTCQVVDCPAFTETDVEIIFHCLQFGNLGARTFPERVAQWNALVLAAHARTAETLLLDGIKTASTAVTATDNGLLGASSNLLSQALTAAIGMRSRHRMDPNAVLRVLFPNWVLDLLVSDVYRSQFQRFDMGPDDFVRLLRAGNVEPTFYIDSSTSGGQVYGTQSAGALVPFPSTVEWYLYPEGSFLYIDGGVLELGLVRDSVLNKSNDFQIFGESFENVAFIGIESLAITSTVCDSGAVALPIANSECGDWGSS